MIRRYSLLIAIAMLAPAAAVGQAGASDGAGVLLGVKTDDNTYRTLWLTVDGAAARLAAAGEGILVPRRDGFWWIEVLHYKEDPGGPEIDTLMVGPTVNGRPKHDTIGVAPDCYAAIAITLRFVGTDHVSRETHSETGCGPHPDAPSTWDMVSLPNARPFDSLFSVAQHEAFERRRSFVRDSLTRATKPEDCPATEPEPSWFVTRKPGRWGLSGGVWGPYVCGNPFDEFDAGIAPPRGAVGANDLVPEWAVIRRTVRNAVDAVSSPQHNVVVVVTASDSLLVYVATGTSLGRRLGAFPGGGAVVMAQWAVGRFVSIWSEQVIPLLRQP
ncbi:MAG TPA: hypothetical protein VGI83_02445 [Gemmatimonadales bacterium]|jgi:hypothetical protein